MLLICIVPLPMVLLSVDFYVLLRADDYCFAVAEGFVL
jgi:hypothetical protein